MQLVTYTICLSSWQVSTDLQIQTRHTSARSPAELCTFATRTCHILKFQRVGVLVSSLFGDLTCWWLCLSSICYIGDFLGVSANWHTGKLSVKLIHHADAWWIRYGKTLFTVLTLTISLQATVQLTSYSLNLHLGLLFSVSSLYSSMQYCSLLLQLLNLLIVAVKYREITWWKLWMHCFKHLRRRNASLQRLLSYKWLWRTMIPRRISVSLALSSMQKAGLCHIWIVDLNPGS